MNILVTGANGQLGREMRIVSASSHHKFFFADILGADGLDTEILDITKADAVKHFVSAHGIDAIVNCAAYTNVDKAETDVDACRLLNGVAPGLLASAMREVGGYLIHISTDYVFGGDVYNTPCSEDVPSNPTGIYGLTKLEGEQAIKMSGCSYAIIRTSWLYSEYGKNFVKTMLYLTSAKPALSVVIDQVGTPTYALDLADAIMAVIDGGKWPARETYHYSNLGVCSWYDFAKAIAELSGHDACDIQPCASSQFPSPVRRPSYSVLDKTKIKEAFGLEIPYWVDSLRICLRNLGELKDACAPKNS